MLRQVQFIAMMLLSSCMMHVSLQAQTAYSITPDPEHPGGLIYKGQINKYTLLNEPSFVWYASSRDSYQPDAALIEAFENARNKDYSFILFGGTWCDDTQFILPRFFKILDRCGFPDESVSFFAVDRNKTTLSNISTAFQIKRVPVIIVMKEGKEKGRIVEYGTTGKWDLELMQLIK